MSLKQNYQSLVY